MSAGLIIAELQQADRLLTRHLEGFRADGVDLFDLAQSGIRSDWVVLDGDGRFEFARYVKGRSVARSAFVWPCWDSFGDLADLVAWRPGRDLALWLGHVAMLGEDQVNGPRLGEPLRVHADVLSWFRAKRQGVFILDYTRAADALRNETLGATDLAHARLLKARLTISAPPVVIMEDDQSAQLAPVSQSESEVV